MPPPTLGLAIAIPRSHGCVLKFAFHRQSLTTTDNRYVVHEALSHEEQGASVLETQCHALKHLLYTTYYEY